MPRRRWSGSVRDADDLGDVAGQHHAGHADRPVTGVGEHRCASDPSASRDRRPSTENPPPESSSSTGSPIAVPGWANAAVGTASATRSRSSDASAVSSTSSTPAPVVARRRCGVPEHHQRVSVDLESGRFARWTERRFELVDPLDLLGQVERPLAGPDLG